MRFLIPILLFALKTHAQAHTELNGALSTNTSIFSWRQISGPQSALKAPNSAICPIDSLTAGISTYELTCSNEFGESKDSVNITVTLPQIVQIINPKYSRSLWNDVLSWSVNVPDSQVSYYLLEKQAGNSFSLLYKLTAKGVLKYSYSVFRLFGTKPLYRVSIVYKNGTRGGYYTF